jgi:hypothetical protein
MVIKRVYIIFVNANLENTMKKIIWIISFTLLVLNCNLKNNLNAFEASDSARNNNHKFWEKLVFEEVKQRLDKTKIIPLKSKELDSDSIEIRVWVGFDRSPLRGLILKRTGQESEGVYIPPIREVSSSANAPYLLHHPKSGWDDLWEKLEELEIKTLPDWTEIGMEPDYTDTRIAVIEIKTSDSYKTYMSFGFNTPKELERKQVRHVYEILDVMSNEFGVELYHFFP